MDEEQTAAQMQDVAENSEQSTEQEHINSDAQQGQSQQDDSQGDDGQAGDSGEQGQDDSQGELTPRQQKRVDQVEAQAKEYKLNKILDRVQNVRGSNQSQQSSNDNQSLNYRDIMDAPDEVYQQLEKDRQTAQQSAREQGRNEAMQTVQAMEWRTNIKLDLPLVKDKLDKLDPADAAAIDREYLIYSGFDQETGMVRNPDISYADFVEAQIDRAERLAANMNLASQKNIAQQASQTGIRPDGGGRQGLRIESPQDIANMSEAEFEKNRAAIYKAAGIPL